MLLVSMHGRQIKTSRVVEADDVAAVKAVLEPGTVAAAVFRGTLVVVEGSRIRLSLKSLFLTGRSTRTG